jgi:hypothetical protein
LSSADWTTFNGKASNSFTTIAVATQTSIVADTATDTLTIVAGTGVTITTNDSTDTLTISATGSGGTVTSISTTAPITGGPITGTGTIAITQSGVSTDGYLSSTDWGTFNSKQPQLNGTGFVKASGTTISYDNSTYYLASNPSGFTSNAGTVTSVDLTAGTGITVSGGPITNSGSITVTNNDLGSSQNIFKNIAVTGQTTIVADTNNDTLTVVGGTGISVTTNHTTDTLTITNTAATSISCFSAYSSTGVTLTTTATAYNLNLNTETVKDATVFTHSTSVNPEQVTVLLAGTYEISYSGTLYNANSDQDSAAAVQFDIYKNGSLFIDPLNTVQTVSHVNIDNYNYINQVANSYIVTLAVNDVIKLVVTANYQAVGPHSPAVIFGFVVGANNNLTIKKLS